jgi:hypothetical protein
MRAARTGGGLVGRCWRFLGVSVVMWGVSGSGRANSGCESPIHVSMRSPRPVASSTATARAIPTGTAMTRMSSMPVTYPLRDADKTHMPVFPPFGLAICSHLVRDSRRNPTFHQSRGTAFSAPATRETRRRGRKAGRRCNPRGDGGWRRRHWLGRACGPVALARVRETQTRAYSPG